MLIGADHPIFKGFIYFLKLEYLFSSNADWTKFKYGVLRTFLPPAWNTYAAAMLIGASSNQLSRRPLSRSTWNTYAAAMLIGASADPAPCRAAVGLEYLCSSNADWSIPGCDLHPIVIPHSWNTYAAAMLIGAAGPPRGAYN